MPNINLACAFFFLSPLLSPFSDLHISFRSGFIICDLLHCYGDSFEKNDKKSFWTLIYGPSHRHRIPANLALA